MEMNDPRIVYGALCTWWESIQHAARSSDAVPVCPQCRRPLFEMDSMEDWQSAVDAWAERCEDPDYPKYIAWLRGKCYPNHETAKEVYSQPASQEHDRD